MDNLQNLSEEVIGGADGPTAVFLAGKLGTISMGISIAAIVAGLLFCFLGLRLIKVICALLGFGVGAAAGAVISSIADITGFTRIIIIFGCAIVLAALVCFLHRVGIFLMTFIATVSVVFTVVGAGDKIYVMAGLGAAVVLGVVAMIFAEPGAIIITSLIGGLSAGTGIASVAGLANPLIGLGIAGALAVIGMIIQFFMYSKRTGRKEKTSEKKRKKKDFMESEVEKARMLLDDDEEEDIED